MEMVNLDVIITACIGLLTTISSAGASWFFARRKYNSEVDNNLIKNMQDSLEFYKKLSDDNKERLEEVLRRNEELEKRDEALEAEVRQLRTQMFNLMSQICMDLTCKVRQSEIKAKKKNNNRE